MSSKTKPSPTLFLTRVALCTAFMCVSAMLFIPFAVPFTLQVLALYLIIFTFGGATALACSALYVFLGLIGLPVFSGFSGGIGQLFMPSGGFIPGFVLAALVYFLCERLAFLHIGARLRTLLSFLALYASAAAVLVFLYTDRSPAEIFTALAYYIAPYIPLDVLKIAVAALASKRLIKHMKL